jgi:hypothetical protein
MWRTGSHGGARRWTLVCASLALLVAALVAGCSSESGSTSSAAPTHTVTTLPVAPTSTGVSGVRPSPPSTAAGPPDGRALANACLASLRSGQRRNLTYQPKKQMAVGKSSAVVVVLSKGGAPPGLITGTESTVVIPVSTPCVVQAELDGDDFDISPSGPREQSFATASYVDFRWTVTPKRSGDLQLVLTIYPVVEVGGSLIDGSAHDYTNTIDVTSTPKSLPSRFGDLLSNNLLFLAIVTGMVTAIATVALDRSSNRRERAAAAATGSELVAEQPVPADEEAMRPPEPEPGAEQRPRPPPPPDPARDG